MSMANRPRAQQHDQKSEGEPAPDRERERHREREFVNEPSGLDEATHQELRLMHQEAAAAMLFAKDIQWRSVGALLLVYGAIIAIATFTTADKSFRDLLTILSIVLASGVFFVLLMYQFWQLNEMTKIDEIEKQFSSLYRKIGRIKSRREGNIHRYTLLLFMMVVVVLGVVVVNVALHQVLGAAKG
jgi:hypothetical protein